MGRPTNEQVKARALTELYNSNQLQEKIEGVCYRHGIPLQAEIQKDILQTTFEHLMKYDTRSFIKAYRKDKNRILALAVSIAIKRGVLLDKRCDAGYKHSGIAQHILHKSNLRTLNYIDSVKEYNDDFNVVVAEDEAEDFSQRYDTESEEYFKWLFIRRNLNRYGKWVLNKMLSSKLDKLKKREKKEFKYLSIRIEELITLYENPEKMEQLERIQKADTLLKYLYEYYANNKQVRMPIEEQLELKKLYQLIFGVSLDISCPTCTIHGLNMLQAWRERALAEWSEAK